MAFSIYKPFILVVLLTLTTSKYVDLHFTTMENDILEDNDSSVLRDLHEDVPLIDSPLDRLLVDLCVGSQQTCLKAKISSSFQYIWLTSDIAYEKGFDKSKSSSFKETDKSLSLSELYGTVEGNICQDTLSIGSYTLNKFPFLLTDSKIKYDEYQGAIGFGYLYDDESYSFLDTLAAKTKISNKIFYIKYTSKKEGIIRLGEFPPEMNANKGKYSYKTCKAIDTTTKDNQIEANNRWECELNGIYYGNQNGRVEYIKVKDRVNFSLGSNILSFPLDVYDDFIRKYMQKYFDSGDCALEQMRYFEVVYCKESFDYNQLGEVNYILGKWSLKFEPKDLFVPYEGRLRFGIYGHKGKNVYLLGSYFFKKYIVVFNKQDKHIGLLLNNY
jgi:hypothetical protein